MILSTILKRLKYFDWILFGSVVLLICFGLAALYSIAASYDEANFANFKKQIFFALAGIILLFILSIIDYRSWLDYSYLIYIGVAFLLVMVLFFGNTVRGTTGWFSLFGLNFQPVELAKIVMIGAMASFLNKHSSEIRDLKNFFKSGCLMGLYFILVLLQPDFGSAMILFFIWLAMIIFAGTSLKHLLVLLLIFAVLFGFAWFFLFKDYQKDRILSFVNPELDPYGRGYHVRQAIIAIGAGGFLGRGLGLGSQSQLKFIPASQTDFIFAVVAEELGFLGVCLLLFFIFLLFYRLYKTALLVKDNFSLLLIFGVIALFFSQFIINIGMNMGIVPVTGISLPFLSYGGSFLVILLLVIGIIESIVITNKS